jgi:hypothetical protein
MGHHDHLTMPAIRPPRRRRHRRRGLGCGPAAVALVGLTSAAVLLILLGVDAFLTSTTSVRWNAAGPMPTTPPATRAAPVAPTTAATTPAVVPGRVVTFANTVADAVAVGRARHLRVAVAVYDRQNQQYFTGGDVDAYYPSASVMKVFIATRLLVGGQADDPDVRARLHRMIALSDDAIASAYYPVAGGAGVTTWVSNRYHIKGIAPTTRPEYWGETRITARAMVAFYQAVAVDAKVGPWLLDAMADARPTAADGFAQLFGLPAVTTGWRVKQGWMCCLDGKTRMHSTGFVGGDRYTVALLTEGGRDVYGDFGRQTLTSMARALLPGGTVPGLS